MPRQVQETRKGIHLIQGSLKSSDQITNVHSSLGSSLGFSRATPAQVAVVVVVVVADLSDVSFLLSTSLSFFLSFLWPTSPPAALFVFSYVYG